MNKYKISKEDKEFIISSLDTIKDRILQESYFDTEDYEYNFESRLAGNSINIICNIKGKVTKDE